MRKKAIKTQEEESKNHLGEILRTQEVLRKEMKEKSLVATIIVTAFIVAGLGLFTLPHAKGGAHFVSLIIWTGFVGLVGFLIVRTGRISRWRGLFFIVLAWGFLLEFKAVLLGLHGRLFFSPEVREVPYCHIAMVSQIFSYGYQQLLAMQSGRWALWGPLSFGFLWLLITLAMGRGWCSWGCFYGGLDEGFSRILKKPLWKNLQIPAHLRDLPAALLLVFALLSLGTMLPLFCLWVCPLKITTAFLDPNDGIRKIQLTIFVVVGLVALILLPLILKKRVFCGLLCPFGAWQSLFGGVHPVRVTIDPATCSSCGLCVKACPTFVLTQDNMHDHKVGGYCNHCGACMSVCPSHAISYTLLGRSLSIGRGPVWLKDLLDVNVIYVVACLWVGGVVGSLFVPPLLARLMTVMFK